MMASDDLPRHGICNTGLAQLATPRWTEEAANTTSTKKQWNPSKLQYLTHVETAAVCTEDGRCV